MNTQSANSSLYDPCQYVRSSQKLVDMKTAFNLTLPIKRETIKTGGRQLSFFELLPTLATHQLQIHLFVKLVSSLNVFIFIVSSNSWLRCIGQQSTIVSTFQGSHFSTSFVVYSRETVSTNIPVGQPLLSMGFPVLNGIYRLAINQSNFSKPGLYELVT